MNLKLFLSISSNTQTQLFNQIIYLHYMIKGSLQIIGLALAIVFIANSQITPIQSYSFEQFVIDFNKTYKSPADEQEHRMAFERNVQEIMSSGRELVINKFLDLTQGEKKTLLNYNPLSRTNIPISRFRVSTTNIFDPPSELDYRKFRMVSPVQDQGVECGSCWAFSTTAQYQSLFLKLTQTQYDLSEQYVLQCTLKSTCDGGFPVDAIRTFTRSGIPLQKDFPYKADDSFFEQFDICYESNNGQFKILPQKIERVSHYEELGAQQLRNLLFYHGPFTVGIAADTLFLNWRQKGQIYSNCKERYRISEINHAVLLIGWTTNGDWIIKNSWGEDWGDQGFAIISQKRDCGISLLVDVIEIEGATPPLINQQRCGNGLIERDEDCDDQNTINGDGCSNNCTLQKDYECKGQPSACNLLVRSVCGNRKIQEGESCDDGSRVNGDGCSIFCQIEESYQCLGEPSVCMKPAVCGNRKIENGQKCDDGNLRRNDGCSSNCQVQNSYECSGQPSICKLIPVCGNGNIQGGQGCDDNNSRNLDGCSSFCQVQFQFECRGSPSVCSKSSYIWTSFDDNALKKIGQPTITPNYIIVHLNSINHFLFQQSIYVIDDLRYNVTSSIQPSQSQCAHSNSLNKEYGCVFIWQEGVPRQNFDIIIYYDLKGKNGVEIVPIVNS